jgi:hypothetical protein
MAKTLLLLGPAGAGKTSLIRVLAAEHPDHHWHLVQLETCQNGSPTQTLRVDTHDWAGLWHVRYRQSDLLAILPELVSRIAGKSPAQRTIIAFESLPDPVLRHALSFDLRVFVMPPIRDDRTVFRDVDESRCALQEILRDTSAMTAAGGGSRESCFDEPDPESSEHSLDSIATQPRHTELNESQIQRFLTGPLGSELAARVHLQPAFGAIADADLVVMNTAAAECFHEADTCWHKIQTLLGRLHKSAHHQPLTYACDLSEPRDPSFVRILRHMGESLCRV